MKSAGHKSENIGVSARSEHTGAERLIITICFLILVGSFILFFCGLYSSRHVVIDDAFITFRYARNVAQGLGFVFNPGGPAVEGFTNLFMVLLMVPAFWLNMDPLFYARMISVLFTLASLPPLLLGFRILVRREVFRYAWPLPILLFLGHYVTAYHATLGLETMVYTALVITCFWLFACIVEEARKGLSTGEPRLRGWVTAFFAVGFITGLTRPEGFAVTGILGIVLVMSTRKSKVWIPGAAMFGFLFLAYAIFKWFIFSSLVPNSFYFKVSGRHGLLPGIDFVLNFIFAHSGWLAIATLSMLLCDMRSPRIIIWSSLGFLLAFFLLLYLRTKPIMAWEHRYLVPYLFVIIYAVAAVFGELITQFLDRKPMVVSRIIVAYLAAFTSILLLLGPKSITFVSTAAKSVMGVQEPAPSISFDLHYREMKLGKLLSILGLGPDLSIAFHDAGQIPFFSNCHFIDIDGLNDSYIARSRDGNQLVKYILNLHPDLIIFASRGKISDPADIRRHLFGSTGLIGSNIEKFYDSSIKEGYSYLATFKTNFYDLNFYLRAQSPNYDLIKKKLPGLLGS